MKNKINNEIIEELKKYGIQDTDIVLRVISIKSKLENEINVNMSNEELFSFLGKAMNNGKMNIWLIKKHLEGINLTLNDKLKKFFELESDEDILGLYYIEQNYYGNKINKVRKLIKERKNVKNIDSNE